MTYTLKNTMIASIAALALVGCGGGGSNSTQPVATTAPAAPTPTPPPTPVSNAPAVPDFVANQFPPSNELRAVCETVRTDTDLDGNPRPDIQGELLHELFWLRSFMDETYLFFDQVADSDPNDFTDIGAYFDERLTTVVTPTGRLVDRFSFIQSTEDREATQIGAPTFGYGAEFARIRSTSPNRDWRVSFTQDGSNAEAAGFTRGARILTIDGIDFLNGSSDADIDGIIAGLFPTSIGEDHVFGVRFPDGTEQDITVTSESITIEPVNAVEIIQNGSEQIGYIHYTTFNPFSGEEQLFDAFTQLSIAEVDDLVLDFRYNGGGLLAIAAQIGYMAAGPVSENRVFYAQEFNSRAPNINPLTGETVGPIPFLSETRGFSVEAGEDLPSLNLPRVFVLTTEQSCSASEAVMNGLLGIGIEVIQIGTRTCGKPTGQIPVENCGITYIPLHFRGVNAVGFGDFDDGLVPNTPIGSIGLEIPGCEILDDFAAPLGDPNEALLSAAITYANTGTCQSNVSSKVDANGPAISKVENFETLSDPLVNHPRMIAIEANRTLLDLKGTSAE